MIRVPAGAKCVRSLFGSKLKSPVRGGSDQQVRRVVRMAAKPVINVDVWSDVACPWCYIGSKRLTKAMTKMGDQADIKVTWHAFLLDGSYHYKHPEGQILDEYLVSRFGPQGPSMKQNVIASGIPDGATFKDYKYRANTLPSHRLIVLARRHGKDGAATAALWKKGCEEGANLSETSVLVEVAKEIGLQEDIEEYLAGDGGMDEVAADVQGAQRRSVTGVPAFFVSGGKEGAEGQVYKLSGAQPVEVFERLFHGVMEESK